MVSETQQKNCVKLYRRRSSVLYEKKAKDYEKWLLNYIDFYETQYNQAKKEYGLSNRMPDFDTYCRYQYKSYVAGYNPECVKTTQML